MEPVIIPRSEHTISRRLIDPDAVKVLYRLHRAGYSAFLVGGGVRDLLLERNPKDFDISTDAHPHQVKRLFRNCRLIGRRFRLAHVHFGDKILEVSTFRKRSDDTVEENGEKGEGDLLIRSDNTFGTAEEDALRRDFTINGLFYDIGTFSLIDYVGGLKDLNDRVIRTIGDPDIRFREDPVRMIRAIKFAARLGFSIDPSTYEAILRHREEIMKSAQPRVLEEVYRLLSGGSAEESFRLLQRTGLLQILMPEVSAHIDQKGGADSTTEQNPLWKWLARLDARKAEGMTLGNPIMIGALVAEMAFGADVSDPEDYGRLTPEIEDRVREILASLSVPRRDTERIFQMYRAQRRLVGQRSRRFSPRAFVHKNYFPEAFQFFSIAVEVMGRHEDVLAKWQELAQAAGVDESPEMPGTRRRRRRRRRGGRYEDEFGRNGSESDGAADDAGEAAEIEPVPPEAAPATEPEGEPVAQTRPARRSPSEDDDEDSQIRFLGWSDQPEILKSRGNAPAPIINPYTRSVVQPGQGPRGPRWRGGHGTGAAGDRPYRGSPARGGSGGPGGHPRGQAADGQRRDRDGRRGGRRGRRRSRSRQGS